MKKFIEKNVKNGWMIEKKKSYQQMKNKIISLRGKIKCRILDTVIENGYSLYFVVDIKSGKLALVRPRDIIDIIEYNDELPLH